MEIECGKRSIEFIADVTGRRQGRKLRDQMTKQRNIVTDSDTTRHQQLLIDLFTDSFSDSFALTSTSKTNLCCLLVTIL